MSDPGAERGRVCPDAGPPDRSRVRSGLPPLRFVRTGRSNSDPDAQWGVHGGVVSGPDIQSVHGTFGVHWRPRLTGALGLEVSAGYERLSWAGPGGTVEADHVPVEGSIIFYFLFTRRVQPYLLAGIGYHWVNPHGAGFANGDPYESDNLFGLHRVAGVHVRAGANLRSSRGPPRSSTSTPSRPRA